jgi:heme/copper-type cytochrome/quinol oxidase subunit 3
MSTIRWTYEARPDTRTTNVRVGMWLFLASEAMLFASLVNTGLLALATLATVWFSKRRMGGRASLVTRAGAAVLVIAAAVVLLAFARFAVRLVKAGASADVPDGEPRDPAC